LAKITPEDSLNKIAGDNSLSNSPVQALQGVDAGEFQGQGRIGFTAADVNAEINSRIHNTPNFNSSAYSTNNFLPPGAVREQMNRYGELHQPAGLPHNDEEIPPLGYAIAQLKGIYILAENAQ